MLRQLETQDLGFSKSRVPHETRCGVHHLLPCSEGCSGPLGDILFMDELAVTITTGNALMSIGRADAVLWGKLGDGMSFWSPL